MIILLVIGTQTIPVQSEYVHISPHNALLVVNQQEFGATNVLQRSVEAATNIAYSTLNDDGKNTSDINIQQASHMLKY